MLSTQTAKHWWTLTLRGVIAIIFGIMAFVMPGLTLAVLVILFGAYAFLDGIVSIFHGFLGETDHRWLLFLKGGVGVIAGVVAVIWPGMTAVVLLYVIAIWAIVTGIFEIIQAIRLRKEIEGEWLLILSGILSILLGAFLLASPGAGALALIWVIGGYAIVAGVVMIVQSLRLRGYSGSQPTPQPA